MLNYFTAVCYLLLMILFALNGCKSTPESLVIDAIIVIVNLIAGSVIEYRKER